MSLTAGTRIGNYEIVAPLGAGGMGEVYRARDTRLDRDVAIKALPAAFAEHPDRLARFDREAKLLASLNHPNIAAIYGLEDVGGRPHLVLELIEGESLAERLARGAVPVGECLEIATRIAAAIEAAHERGVVHRDLKPGNVMCTPAGAVKVLDFGLAKADGDGAPAMGMLSNTPTVGLGVTAQGLVLGTAPYMSPEQARGRAVDRRTDVWAFGCIVFECLTGRPSFAGETASDVVARILEREPDWAALPGGTPRRLVDLLRRCLTKEAAERPRDIGDLRRELQSIALERSSPAAAAPAVAEKPSLAVLYFDNLADDKESEYFCSGITEDILTDLSKIRGLRVASRNAVARYRGAPADIPKVATELSVGAVLEGSVRRAGDRVRITAQLIAADGFHLWAERYDRTLADVFAVQEEIASAIAEALRVTLTREESNNLVRNRPDDVRAYDLYLKGRAAYENYDDAGIRGALDLFQQAIAIDPDYALAWAGVADAHGQFIQYELDDQPAEHLKLGVEAARRAIAIQPRLPQAHKALSLVLSHGGDREGGHRALLQALEIDPRFTPALINLGVDGVIRADLATAERSFRRVVEIDPQEDFARAWLAYLLTATGREDEAVSHLRRMRARTESGPGGAPALYTIWSFGLEAWSHARRNDAAAVAEVVGEFETRTGGREAFASLEAYVAARAGRLEEAREKARQATARFQPGIMFTLALTATALRLGDWEGARVRTRHRHFVDLAPTLARLEPELHALLDERPLAPRRRDAVLVWPLEAPMLDARVHPLFREVQIVSGLPEGSER